MKFTKVVSVKYLPDKYCKVAIEEEILTEEKVYTAQYGTLVCYNGNSGIYFEIIKEKNGKEYVCNEDFPFLLFAGNILDKTEIPKMVVDFMHEHGETITLEEVEKSINNF